jgi:hypothetical protein
MFYYSEKFPANWSDCDFPAFIATDPLFLVAKLVAFGMRRASVIMATAILYGFFSGASFYFFAANTAFYPRCIGLYAFSFQILPPLKFGYFLFICN